MNVSVGNRVSGVWGTRHISMVIFEERKISEKDVLTNVHTINYYENETYARSLYKCWLSTL